MKNLTGWRPQILEWSRSKWAGLALVGCVFALAAALSWRRWPDILVDFGMQLYLPWRIFRGDVLYRDMMYLTGGPLSQYFNALLFKIFGVSFRTLIFANLAITAGMLVLVYRRFLAAADRLTATMICLAIVLVFAFQQYVPVGNYNYVTPYCHEVFHGLVLSLVVVMWLSDWVEKGRIRLAVAAGVGSGLVFLTKPDVFVALMVCVVAAFFAGLFRQRTSFAAKSLVAFLLAGLIPLVMFFALFLRVEDWRTSMRSVISAWVPLWHTTITQDPFYQWCLGLDTPFLNLEKMAAHFIFIVLTIVIYALAIRHVTESRFKWVRPFWMVWPLLIAPLLILAVVWNWVDCGRSLPLLGLSACVLLGLTCRKIAAEPAAIFPLLWNVFGLALLAKLGLFPRIWQYGFALAMPAFAGAVYLFVWLLPLRLEQKYRVCSHWFRVTACLVLTAGFVRLFLLSESYYFRKNFPVGSGGDKIVAYSPTVDPFHGTVEIALSWIETNAPPDATLAVLPEGTMINYLSRRVNPTPCLVWVPPVMAVFGQTNMTAAFEKNSPDYVLIIARSASEFGVSFFGYDSRYGMELMRWIEGHYDRVYPAPDPAGKSAPQQQPFFELQILKRRPPVLPAGNN
ncbi:MAG: hypothetical protein ACLP2Y_09145 [Limisphaerales bacterium]